MIAATVAVPCTVINIAIVIDIIHSTVIDIMIVNCVVIA